MADNGRGSGGYSEAVEPCTVVLFGASGDLAKRKVDSGHVRPGDSQFAGAANTRLWDLRARR